jgi:predicted RNA-binding Zn ribbon-like protein
VYDFVRSSFVSQRELSEEVRNLVARDDVAAALRFDGGSPLFNLLATKGARGRGPVERLIDDDCTRAFLNRAFGIVAGELADDLESVRSQLIAIRESVEAIISYQIFMVEADRDRAFAGVGMLNEFMASRGSPRRLIVDSNPRILVEAVSSPLEAKISKVISEVSDILSDSEKRSRVKVCASEGCKAPFMDRSPTNNRVWCSMAICGNRAKAKRYYHSLR